MSDEIRRQKHYHPEMELPLDEVSKRRKICSNVLKAGVYTSLAIMIVETVMVAKIASTFNGWTGFYIALFGIMFTAATGLLFAYSYGQKMGKLYSRYILAYNSRRA